MNDNNFDTCSEDTLPTKPSPPPNELIKEHTIPPSTKENLNNYHNNIYNEIEYVERFSPLKGWTFIPLKPTGKWKLVTNFYEDNTLYIQHRRFLVFTSWIHESNIVLRRKSQIFIADCRK